MKQNSSFLLTAAVTLLVACSGPKQLSTGGHSDPALRLSQQNVNAALYQNASAEVAWMQEQAFAHARLKLDINLLDSLNMPPAVIVDVDETMLDNSPYELENLAAGRSYTPETWKSWTSRASAKPIPGALDFVHYAVSRGCAIYYVTNRDHDEKGATIINLAALGFPMADSLHVMTMQGTSDKTPRQKMVERQHSVVLLIGDQLTDYRQVLKDRSTEHGLPAMYAMEKELERYFILLPNSTYGYWRDGITGRGTEAEKLQRVKGFIEERTK